MIGVTVVGIFCALFFYFLFGIRRRKRCGEMEQLKEILDLASEKIKKKYLSGNHGEGMSEGEIGRAIEHVCKKNALPMPVFEYDSSKGDPALPRRGKRRVDMFWSRDQTERCIALELKFIRPHQFIQTPQPLRDRRPGPATSERPAIQESFHHAEARYQFNAMERETFDRDSPVKFYDNKTGQYTKLKTVEEFIFEEAAPQLWNWCDLTPELPDDTIRVVVVFLGYRYVIRVV